MKKILILLCLVLSTSVYADNKQQSLEELVQLMDMDKMVDNMYQQMGAELGQELQAKRQQQ